MRAGSATLVCGRAPSRLSGLLSSLVSVVLLLSSGASVQWRSDVLRPVAASSASDIRRADHAIRATIGFASLDFLNGAHSLYQLQDPLFNLTTFATTSAAATLEMTNGITDIVIGGSASVLTASQRAVYPDLLQFPLFAQQFAIAYGDDIHQLSSISQNLVFTIPILARIFSANITTWNHPDLTTLNPKANLPQQPIQVVMGSRYTIVGMDCLCDVFNRADPGFAARFPCTSSKFTPPLANYAVPPILAPFVQNVIPSAKTSKWAIAFGSIVSVLGAGMNIADVINTAGRRITPSLLSGSLAMYERGFPLVNGAADLSLAAGPGTYPFSQYTYIMLSASVVRTTCAQKRNVLAFVSFLYQSATISFLANSQATPMLPKPLQTAIGVQAGLKTMTCVSGTSVYQASSEALGLIFGSAPLSSLMTRLFGLYTALYPSLRVYNFLPGNEVETYSLINHDSVLQVLQPGEKAIDAAISVSTVPDRDSGVLHTSFPFATASVALVYALPKGLTTADVSSLVLDLETVGMIFTGSIGFWNHTRIARLNPQLMDAFAAKPTVSKKLTVVLCCSASRGASPTLTLMRTALQPTHAFQSSPLAASPTLDWTQVWTSTKKDVASVQCDAEEKMIPLVQKTKGAIGYMRVNYVKADDTVHVRLLPWRGNDEDSLEPVLANLDANGFYTQAYNVSIAPQPSTGTACVVFTSEQDQQKNGGAYDISGAWLDFTRSEVPQNCWPLTSAVQLLLPQGYSDAAVDGARQCSQGRETLQLMKWLVSSPALSSALNLEGFGRLSDSPIAQAYILSTIDLVPCDGQPLLSSLPTIWTLSTGIASFLYAYSGVLIFFILLTTGVTAAWRNLDSIRTSGVSVLLVQSCGFVLLFISVILWTTAQGPFGSNCHAFWWLVNLGFSMGFLPMGLKLWKLNRMLAPVYVAKHRRAASKITKGKLTNRKMMILLGGTILLDVVLLAISSGGSQTGFTFTTEVDTTGSTFTSYTHCRPDANGDRWVAALLGYKAVWVLWSVLQTFQARSGAPSSLALAVKEAVHISYPLYNLVFSSVIIVPITLLLNIHGDGLVILVGVLLIWSVSVAWVCMFAPKFYHELAAHRRKQNLLVDGTSMLSDAGASGKTGAVKTTGTFTFLPLTTMSRDELARYLLVFDRHIVEAKRRLLVLGGIHLLEKHGQVEYRQPLLTGHDEHGEYPERSQSFSRHMNHSVSRSHHPVTNGVGVGGTGGANATGGAGNGMSRRPSLSVRGFGGGPLSPGAGRASHQVSQVRENSVRLSLTNNYMPSGSPGTRTRQLSVQNRVVPSAIGSPTGTSVRTPSPVTIGGMRSPSSGPINSGVSFALNTNGGPSSPTGHEMSPKTPTLTAFGPRGSSTQRPPSSPGGLPLHPSTNAAALNQQGIVRIGSSPQGPRRKLTHQRPPLSQTTSPKINTASTSMPPVVVTFHPFDRPPSADFSIGSGMVSEALKMSKQQSKQNSPGGTPSPTAREPRLQSNTHGVDGSPSNPVVSGHGTHDSMDSALSPTSLERSPSPPSPMVPGLPPRDAHHLPASNSHSLSPPASSPGTARQGTAVDDAVTPASVSSPSSEEHVT